jgi:hypothetical protein
LKICNVVNLSVIQNFLEDASSKITRETSRFIPSRLIVDNVLATYGCIHKIKNTRKCKSGICAIKLDMHKAYGMVEWTFFAEYDEQTRFS